jgi:hypothetical protein
MKRKMKKNLTLITVILLAMTALAGCGTPSYQANLKTAGPAGSNTPFSLAGLPAAGYIDLGPVNAAELERLGLGGPAPINNPPSSPFNQYGMYWSQPFPVAEGDTIQLKVYSDTPISWFGVDWLSLNIRGILATTELDEDGRTFDPQYPAHSSVETGASGYALTVSYAFAKDTQCVLVVKNASAGSPQHLSMAVTAKSPFTIKRLLKDIPLIKNLVKSDKDEIED